MGSLAAPSRTLYSLKIIRIHAKLITGSEDGNGAITARGSVPGEAMTGTTEPTSDHPSVTKYKNDGADTTSLSWIRGDVMIVGASVKPPNR